MSMKIDGEKKPEIQENLLWLITKRKQSESGRQHKDGANKA